MITSFSPFPSLLPTPPMYPPLCSLIFMTFCSVTVIGGSGASVCACVCICACMCVFTLFYPALVALFTRDPWTSQTNKLYFSFNSSWPSNLSLELDTGLTECQFHRGSVHVIPAGTPSAAFSTTWNKHCSYKRVWRLTKHILIRMLSNISLPISLLLLLGTPVKALLQIQLTRREGSL